MATRIDGKAFAENLRVKIAADVAALKASKGITPGLAVVLVGEDPASQVYVANKGKACKEAGMNSYDFRMPSGVSEAELIAKVKDLNADPNVHGILVQLPLPKHINENVIINSISPDKDVDGFHVINAGRLMTGQDGFVPCTPLGCSMLLKDYFCSPPLEGGRDHGVIRGGQSDEPPTKTADAVLTPPQGGSYSPRGGAILAGKHAVVIGRSNIVGKPMAQLLLKESCTVTIAHSKTKDLPSVVKQADIVVAAVGKPEMVKGDWIKPGAVVIDVGINRMTLPDEKTKLVGDVAYDEAEKVASAITPVPGGVGPMTIACLLANTLKAAKI